MGKNSNITLICTAIAYILFAVCWAASVGEKANWLGLLILEIWAIVVFFHFPMFYLRYPFVIFTAVTNILGVLIIERTSLFLPELNTYGYSKHSLFYLVFTWFLVLSSIYILEFFLPSSESVIFKKETSLNLKIRNIGVPIFSIVGIVFTGFFLLQFLSVFFHPFFLEQMDRFLYAEKYISPLQGKLIGYFTYILPAIVAGIFHSNYRKMSLRALIVFAVYKFWTGEKFGAFFLVFCYIFTIISYLKQNLDLKSTIKYLTRALLVLFLLTGVIFGHRILLYHSTVSQNKNYLIQRIAQNGQLWWAMYDLSNASNLDTYELNDELDMFFTLNNKPTYKSGIYKIMEKTTPLDLFWNKINSNSRYADSTFASIYYYFKEPGLMISAILFGILFWGLTRYFLAAYSYMHIPELIISGKMMVIMNTVLTQSDFYMIFSYQTMICIFLMFFLGICRSYLARKNALG
ncbi:DUF6418 domain-containing protein [Acidaminococcus sp.]|uniref:DUF6418 domain-containing protein n=1 Tax=Acidaminococcus sp. TaxID=1872103 RepID=UPI003D7CE1A4